MVGNQRLSERSADMFILIIAAAPLLIVIFFSVFVYKILSFMFFWATSTLPSKGCGKGQQPQGRPASSLLLTASLSDVSTVFIHYSSVERCKHSTPASWTSHPPETRHLARVCVSLVCNRTAYLQGKYAWFTFLMLSYRELVFRRNPAWVLGEKIVLSNRRGQKKKK